MLRKVHAGALLVCCLLLVQCGVGGDLVEAVPDASDLFEAGTTLTDSTAGEGFIVPVDIEELVDHKPDLTDSTPLEVSIPDICQPACDGKSCGDDGCGGPCGECEEGEWCRDDGLCETMTCDIIYACFDTCYYEDTTCQEECIAAAPIELQAIYHDWDTCFGSSGYYYDGPCGEPWEDDQRGWDECMFDFLISQCGDEYYACWPPGDGLCIDLHLCFISCPEDETYITCANDCYADASLEALDLWDIFIDCMDDNGYFECAEDDLGCMDTALEQCGPQLKECAHGELSCTELMECADDCAGDDGTCEEVCKVQGTIPAQENYEELEDCIVSQCTQEPDADCSKGAMAGACLGEHTVCLGCEPDCYGKECGDDGCEGSCGECDDDYLCTNDTCDATVGQCIHLSACDDGNACSTDLCDPKTGECKYIFIDPDDGNPCTEDLCDCETGCQNLVLPDGTPCAAEVGWICVNASCTCVPNCQGKECGDDGCFGSCGECPADPCFDVCVGGICQFSLIGLEVCDGLDNDCDGLTDEHSPDCDCDGVADCMDVEADSGCSFASWVDGCCPNGCVGDGIPDELDNCPKTENPDQKDSDGDGFGDSCDFGCWLEDYQDWDDDCDGWPDELDCMPSDPETHPEAEELCDEVDNNCNGLVDEKCPCTPECEGKECGNDGCEGSCGECDDGDPDTVDSCEPITGVCENCLPECPGKECGDDGCSGSCGECAPGQKCEEFACMNCVDELWVASWNADDVAPNGSKEKPYPTIQAGVDHACPGALVHIDEGSYVGGVIVDVDGISVVGEPGELALMETADCGIGFLVTASGVTLHNITIEGGRLGVHALGSEEAPLEGLTVEQMTLSQMEGCLDDENEWDCPWPPVLTVGLLIDYATAVALTSNSIEDIGGAGCAGPGPTSGISLHGVAGCIINDNSIANVDGDSWAFGGGAATGIYLNGVSDCIVGGNSVFDIKGGDTSESFGGKATGMLLDDLTGATVEDNSISEVWGGNALKGSIGPAVGISGHGLLECSFSGNDILNVFAGWKAGLPCCDTWGALASGISLSDSIGVHLNRNSTINVVASGASTGKDATGIQMYSVLDCTLVGNLVQLVKGGCGSQSSGDGMGIELYDTAECSIRSNTIRGVEGGCTKEPGEDEEWEEPYGIGIKLASVQPDSVEVVDTIIAKTSHYCLFSVEDNPSDLLTASYSGLFDCGEAETYNADMDDATCLTDAPLFVDAEAGDLHLLPESPCIDSGDPTADYSGEPEPNGCRVNMGAYGNTDETTSAEEAPHCGDE